MPTTTLEGSRRCAASRLTNTSFRSGRKSPNASSSTRHITSRDRTPGGGHAHERQVADLFPLLIRGPVVGIIRLGSECAFWAYFLTYGAKQIATNEEGVDTSRCYLHEPIVV